MTMTITSPTPQTTLALGRRFATCLTAGDVVLMSGRLGSGKTLFVQGVAEGLGISDPVMSPTFVIARIYRDGFMPLVHADAYRLSTFAEFEDLDLIDEGYDGVLMIEWGDSVAEVVGEDHLTIHIEIEGSERVFSFHPSGEWRDRDLEMLT